ncbi:MAG: DUF4160 domain-containing protein [Phycisphaerae bacterium]|nr:DUF4160 domain-containing protein [Phycisphaerae bacterium]
MPEICRFYGIVIAMFYDEHNPPRFHARYGGHKVVIDIRTLSLLEGRFPARALGMVIEWASQHQSELMENWERARNEQAPNKIAPLN